MRKRIYQCLAAGVILLGICHPSWASAEAVPMDIHQPETAMAAAAAKKKPIPAKDRARYEKLRQENQGRLAEKEKFIPTTAQSVIVTFGGISRKESVEDILDRLDSYGAKGTFFVTERELRQNKDIVREIIDRGHEIGIGLRTGVDGDYFETCAQIERFQKRCMKEFGIKPAIARQIFGFDKPGVNEACSALGIRYFGAQINGVLTQDKDESDVNTVFSHVFKKSMYSMGRGQILYIRLDFMNHPLITGQLLDMIKKYKIDNIAYRSFNDSPESNPDNDTAYHMTSIGEVLADKEHAWTYPVPDKDIPEELKPSAVAVKIDDHNFWDEFRKRYIGSPDVRTIARVKGFPESRMDKMDKTGVVKGITDNTIFFGFDDWGSDQSVNRLLYVLRKHHAPCNFFVMTWNVHSNPNLLRVIAENGHDIGGHTNGHHPMVPQRTVSGRWNMLDDKAFMEDVRQSYQILAETVGDVKVNGRPALTRYFRPPTLAVSKRGAEALFNEGYSYIISGYESTEDYDALSLESVIGAIEHGIYDEQGNVRQGVVFVVHMSDHARYTAEALDIILTANEKRPDGDPKKFKTGRLSDYLKDSYDQSRIPSGNEIIDSRSREHKIKTERLHEK